MASDLLLVLKSEHREMSSLADQCTRPSRGFENPQLRLAEHLRAHVAGLERNVLGSQLVGPQGVAVVSEIAAAVHEAAGADAVPSDVPQLARHVSAREEEALLPLLESDVPLTERRRMGKGFRLVRDATLRAVHTGQRRVRSQTELYEVARRAGLERRSRMTQAELQFAVEAWERQARR